MNQGNSGKFVDRNPYICSAGIATDCTDNVAECMKYYSLQDKVDALLHEAGVPDKEPIEYPLPQDSGNRNLGIYTQIRDLISPPFNTATDVLVRELRETAMSSYWLRPTGKRRDPTPGLPKGMNPLTTTFGKPSDTNEALYPLILPPIPQCQVLRDSMEGHELYVKTHQSYWPSEKVDRKYARSKYDRPRFDPKYCFGQKTCYDPRGIGMKRCMKWAGKSYVNEDLCLDPPPLPEPDPCSEYKGPTREQIDKERSNLRKEDKLTIMCTVNSILADRIRKHGVRLGKGAAPNQNILKIPHCGSFGQPPRSDELTVADLMRDCPQSDDRKDMLECIAHFNVIRNALHRRMDTVPFDNIKMEMRYHDKEHTGYIPFGIALLICAQHRIYVDKPNFTKFMTKVGYMLPQCKADCTPEAPPTNDAEFDRMMVNYTKFVDLLNLKKQLPGFGKIIDLPKEFQYYETTSDSANHDYETDIHRCLPVFGAPSVRMDSMWAVKPAGGTRADAEHLGNESNSASNLNPSIMTMYGVTHRDMFLPRDAAQIRSIFENTGVEFPDNSFDVIFKESCRQDCFPGENMTCVETFRHQLQKLATEYYEATL